MASDRSRNWVRKQGADQTKSSFPELFFDLVFVFALIQLSHALASDFSSTAAIESLLLIFAIWWVWINTTWVTNLLDTDKDPVRLLLFGLMFGGILLAIAIPEAFGTQGPVFAVVYSAMQVGRSVFTLYAFRGVNQASFLTFLRITLWMLVSSVFWIAGALEVRTALWSLALLIEYASPAVRYYVPGMGKSARETLDVSGEHMAERCALFVIICLGETILTSGRNAAEHMGGDLTFAVFCSAFLSTGFMWWIYFHHGQEKAADKAEATSEPESVALNLFTYGHLPIVAGIIIAAVGQDLSLSHASEESTPKEALAILGGPALFLIGNIWVKLVAAREMPVSHIVGLVLLVMVALLLPITDNYHIQMFATAVLFVVALWEYMALRRIRAVL
ncbi:low temperature requirement protein LtrA [Rhizobium sp. BK313]|uniref:low temperature requirement protein A n=1 Tax=Rhizobium sp. BK313 TaxID=2587081 RepID=UPI00105DEB30|nr:low temperature requirement protein A [Rhizobium sp. BK313]MBB3452589.1 low temperature requirement protein LtrA [Rhizobium sp. BK313]